MVNGPYKEEFEICGTPDSYKKVVMISSVKGKLIKTVTDDVKISYIKVFFFFKLNLF